MKLYSELLVTLLQQHPLKKISWALLGSWLLSASLLTWFGFAGWLRYPVWLLLLFPAGVLITLLVMVVARVHLLSRLEKILVFGLGFIWLLHLGGVFVPETGFDALWYHLPVVAGFLSAGKITFLPDLYQSVNPLLADLTFLAGFQLGAELGAKVVAYLWALTLLFVSYTLARSWLTRSWSLLAVILISLVQVMAWQASSFYVDLAKACWELGALAALFEWKATELAQNKSRWLVFAALLLGASLATKLFSVLVVPAFLVAVVIGIKNQSWKKTGLTLVRFLCLALIVVAPFYIYAWVATSSPFLSAGLHVAKLSEIGGEANLSGYLWQRLLSIWQLPWQLLLGRDYTSLILLVFFPLTAPWCWQQRHNWSVVAAVLFILTQLGIWWLVPPLSTRYALAGFILWIIVTTVGLANAFQRKEWRIPIIITLVIIISWHLLPRLVVSKRQVEYLLGHQTKQEYLESFYDGTSDEKIKAWYGFP